MTSIADAASRRSNYPIGMNLVAIRARRWAFQSKRQVHGVTVFDRSRPGHESGDAQICAETLGVPVEDVLCRHRRFRHRAALQWAVSPRAHASRRKCGHSGRQGSARRDDGAAAEELEVNAADLETDGPATFTSRVAPHRSISTKDVRDRPRSSSRARPSRARIFLVPLSAVDPRLAKCRRATCYAHACMVAEVEVDDETGEVAMVRMDSAYELRPRAQSTAGRTATGRRRLDGREPRAV